MQSDRDRNHMYEMWGTDELITDYGNVIDRKDQRKMLREIANDERTPKKCDHCTCDTELFENHPE